MNISNNFDLSMTHGQTGSVRSDASVGGDVHIKKHEQVQSPSESNFVRKEMSQDPDEVREQVQEAIKELNSQMGKLETNIEFGFNNKLGNMYVSVLEKNTGKLIGQFPSKEAMALAEHFKEAIGVMFDQKG